MNPRIEKKLSKRLVNLHPALYRKAWIDHDHSEYAYEENSNVSIASVLAAALTIGAKDAMPIRYGQTGR